MRVGVLQGGLTALHISSYKGRASVVDLLLAAGASPGATEDVSAPLAAPIALLAHRRAKGMETDPLVFDTWQEGRTPLHLAAEEGHVETVKLLVAHEAPTGAQTQVSPLHPA